MGTLTIRRLDEKTKARLRVQAAHHGHSMEEEARNILRSAMQNPLSAKESLATAIHKRFAAFGGLKLQLPSRDAMRGTPDLSE